MAIIVCNMAKVRQVHIVRCVSALLDALGNRDSDVDVELTIFSSRQLFQRRSQVWGSFLRLPVAVGLHPTLS